MGEPGQWAEFGLAGLVILALFTVLGLLGKVFATKFENVAKDNREAFKDIQNQHLEERKEWRSDDAARQAASDRVIAELTQAVRDLRRDN